MGGGTVSGQQRLGAVTVNALVTAAGSESTTALEERPSPPSRWHPAQTDPKLQAVLKLIREILELLWKVIRQVLLRWLRAWLRKVGRYLLVLLAILLVLVLLLVLLGI